MVDESPWAPHTCAQGCLVSRRFVVQVGVSQITCCTPETSSGHQQVLMPQLCVRRDWKDHSHSKAACSAAFPESCLGQPKQHFSLCPSTAPPAPA